MESHESECMELLESTDRRIEWEDDATGIYHYHAPGGSEVVYRFRLTLCGSLRLVDWDAEVLLVDGSPVVEAETVYYRIMWHEDVARIVQQIINEIAKGA